MPRLCRSGHSEHLGGDSHWEGKLNTPCINLLQLKVLAIIFICNSFSPMVITVSLKIINVLQGFTWQLACVWLVPTLSLVVLSSHEC